MLPNVYSLLELLKRKAFKHIGSIFLFLHLNDTIGQHTGLTHHSISDSKITTLNTN